MLGTTCRRRRRRRRSCCLVGTSPSSQPRHSTWYHQCHCTPFYCLQYQQYHCPPTAHVRLLGQVKSQLLRVLATLLKSNTLHFCTDCLGECAQWYGREGSYLPDWDFNKFTNCQTLIFELKTWSTTWKYDCVWWDVEQALVSNMYCNVSANSSETQSRSKYCNINMLVYANPCKPKNGVLSKKWEKLVKITKEREGGGVTPFPTHSFLCTVQLHVQRSDGGKAAHPLSQISIQFLCSIPSKLDWQSDKQEMLIDSLAKKSIGSSFSLPLWNVEKTIGFGVERSRWR